VVVDAGAWLEFFAGSSVGGGSWWASLKARRCMFQL